MKPFERSTEQQLRQLGSLPLPEHVLIRLQKQLGQLTPEWAARQYQLGLESLERAKTASPRNNKGATASLEMAIGHLKNALHVYTSETFPQERATALYHLGNAYQKLSRGDHPAILEARRAYQESLEIVEEYHLSPPWVRDVESSLLELESSSRSRSGKNTGGTLQSSLIQLYSQILRPRLLAPLMAILLAVLLGISLLPGMGGSPATADTLSLSLSFTNHRPQGAVWVQDVAWSPNGKYIAALWDDNVVQVWDVQKQKPIFQPEGGWGVGVSWSPDSKFLALVGLDDTIQIWEVPDTTHKPVYTSRQYDAPVQAIAWGPKLKSTLIAFFSSDDQAIHILDLSTQKQSVYPQNRAITTLTWSPDGQYIVSGDTNGLIRVWDIHTGNYSSLEDTDQIGSRIGAITSVNWSSDGAFIAVSSFDGQIRIWDAQTRQLLKRISLPAIHQHESVVFAVAWNPRDDRYLALASYDGSVQIWTRTGTFVTRYPPTDGNRSSAIQTGRFTVAWSPIQDYIATGGSGSILAARIS